MKKRISLMAMGLLPLSMALAQQADQKMLPTGSGGMNQSMGNLSSPNLFDGSTNINIPIHTFGDFGVSLSYNTKGVPVEELSGPAGTHWVLNAGGSITRNVKDIPDEVTSTFNVPSAYNNTVEYSILGRAHAYTAGPPPNNRQYRDRENDEFIVSAGPMQFTFRLGKDGYVFTYPENRYKISPIIAPGTSPDGIHIYYKFEITDDQGTKYYFGTRASEANGSIAFGNTAPGTGGGGYVKDFIYTPKWFLDKVEFTNGQVIDYTYEYMDHPTDGSGTEGLSLYRPNTLTYKPTVISMDPPTDPTWMADIQPSTYILTGIRYPDNTVVNFVFDQGAGYQPSCMKSVKQIEIAQGDNCIKYRLNKAYLKQSTANYLLAEEVPFDNGCNYNPAQGLSLRMILKGIDILSCDESKVQPYYSFEYSHTAPPSRWGNNRDFFGYCNYIADNSTFNNGNNFLLQPTSTKSPFDNSNGPAANINRRVTDDVNIMAALCLTKVKNAYGGSVAFEYELHSGLVAVTGGLPGQPDPEQGNLANHLFTGKDAADGLRLRRTITEDKYRPDSKLITTYTYSGGQFFLNGGYYAYPLVKSANGSFTQYKGTPYWVSAHQLINGSNHGYSQVTATSRDNGSNMLSKTIYYFSNFKEGNTLNYNFPNASANQKHYYQAPYTDKQYMLDWKIGLPLKTETFDQNGNIASRTTNIYDTDIASDFVSAVDELGINIHTMRVSLENAGATVNIMDPAFELPTDSYVPFRGKALLLSTTTEKFTSNTNAVTDVAAYKYDGRRNLTEIKTRNSKNEYFLTRNIYNYDVSGSATLSAMTAAGMEKVIATERWKKGSTGPAGDELYDAGITCYQYQNGLLLTQKVYTLQSLLPTGGTGKSKTCRWKRGSGCCTDRIGFCRPCAGLRRDSRWPECFNLSWTG